MWRKVNIKGYPNIEDLYMKGSGGFSSSYGSFRALFKSTLDNKYYIMDRLPPTHKVEANIGYYTSYFLHPTNVKYNGEKVFSIGNDVWTRKLNFIPRLFYSSVRGKWIGESNPLFCETEPISYIRLSNGNTYWSHSFFDSDTLVGSYTPRGSYTALGYTFEVTEVTSPIAHYPIPMPNYYVSDTLIGEYTGFGPTSSTKTVAVGWAKMRVVGSDASEFYLIERPTTDNVRNQFYASAQEPHYIDVTNGDYYLYEISDDCIISKELYSRDANVGYWLNTSPYRVFGVVNGYTPSPGTYTRVYTGGGTPPEPETFEVSFDSYVDTPVGYTDNIVDQTSYWVEE